MIASTENNGLLKDFYDPVNKMPASDAMRQKRKKLAEKVAAMDENVDSEESE